MTIFRIILFLLIMILLHACEGVFDYSPYAIDFSEEQSNLNVKNIERLHQRTNHDDTVIIALTADTHRDYDEMLSFVNSVNKNGSVDFVLHVGDFADFGLPKQYKWTYSILSKLKVPYIVLPGNHDMVGNGSQAYREMFGELNFSFILNETKYISLNTNSREFEFNGQVPDIKWLDEQLEPADDFINAIVLFHVPPQSNDFDQQLKNSFYESLTKHNNVLLGIHGHHHHHDIYPPQEDDQQLVFINIYAISYMKYNIISIFNNGYIIDTLQI